MAYEPPRPSVFYAVVSQSAQATDMHIVFGPVYHEELARRALSAIDPKDDVFIVKRREIRPHSEHFADSVLGERAMLQYAESAPSEFKAHIMQGVARPIALPPGSELAEPS